MNVEYRILMMDAQCPFTLSTAFNCMLHLVPGSEKNAFDTYDEAIKIVEKLKTDWPKNSFYALEVTHDPDDPYHISIKRLPG